VRIAVFTGSSSGPAEHRRAVAAFARGLALSGAGIVYGGGRVGLMGLVADTALAAGGEVVGVIPRQLFEREIAHKGLTRLDVVGSMHERKARMAELADAFVALPGGAGTLEELSEVWTWGQLGLHRKPAAVLNLGGFYDHLLAQLALMRDSGYLEGAYLAALGVVTDVEGLLTFLDGYRHPPVKWALSAPAANAIMRP
jgi:uncharacterized protein (TIGR00730 family)